MLRVVFTLLVELFHQIDDDKIRGDTCTLIQRDLRVGGQRGAAPAVRVTSGPSQEFPKRVQTGAAALVESSPRGLN